MVTHRELKSFVRFQLDQLSAQNAQHEFEHLCRNLARLRIASNILPATGPVSARGDQGRDAETFRSYLAGSPIATSSFVGLVSCRPIAFAVTLQKKENNLKGKIERDIQSITASGSHVEEIHYFCADDLDSGTRHMVQDWARSEHEVGLEIYDGQAISELLCWRDTFWIANEFLHVPSEMYPEPQDESDDAWYRSLKSAWHSRSEHDLTFASFAEAKSALRHCTFAPDRQNDLPFWIATFETFLTEDTLSVLRYRAMYELAVASLRGLGTMEGHDDRLEGYFSAVIGPDQFADLEDAAVLVTYCLGAIRNHATQLRLDTVVRWRDDLLSVLYHELAANPTIGRKCHLLWILGFVICLSDGYDVPTGHRSPIEIWLELTEHLDRAPLFPVDRLAQELVIIVPILGDESGFDDLAHRVDTILSERAGQAAAAERCRDRAMAFYKQGKILRAISELHEAKIKWFAEETLLGSVLAVLFIARCYQELGLWYAAKYYAMAAAWVSLQSERQDLRDKIWRAVTFASDCDYSLGNWRGYLQLADFGMKTHWWLARRAGDYDAHPELDAVFYHATICQAVAERIGIDLADTVWETICNWGLTVEIETLMPHARSMLADKSNVEVLDFVASQLEGRPFADLASEREVAWEALGITWHVRWSNDRTTNTVAEQFVATLQVATADFAKHDLLLIQTTVAVDVTVGDVLAPTVDEDVLHSDHRWKVVLPTTGTDTGDTGEEREVELLGTAVSVLRAASLLPQDEFMAALEDVVKSGITTKTFVARPYEELYRELCDQPSPLDNTPLPDLLKNQYPLVAKPAHPELRWPDALAPQYSASASREAIARRYERIPRKIPVTLARLSQEPSFQTTLAVLRQEGWKDWHVLLAILNKALNVRMHNGFGVFGPPARSAEEMQHQLSTLVDDLVLESTSPIDTELFTVDELRQVMDVGMATVLKTWGLEFNQQRLDVIAVRKFVETRFNFWSDDVEHEDPFSTNHTASITIVSSA